MVKGVTRPLPLASSAGTHQRKMDVLMDYGCPASSPHHKDLESVGNGIGRMAQA